MTAVHRDVADALELIRVIDDQEIALAEVELMGDQHWYRVADLARVAAPSPAVRSNVITLLRKRPKNPFDGFPRSVS